MDTKMSIVISLVLLVIILCYSNNMIKTEGFGSGFFHNITLKDVRKGIEESKNQVFEIKTEGFENNNEEEPTPFDNTFNPNENVISKYSPNEISEKGEVGDLAVGELEVPEFYKPYDYNQEKPLKEILEVERYDLSAPIFQELETYNQGTMDKIMEDKDVLTLRGGNMSLNSQ
jgi:hypothetical protein